MMSPKKETIAFILTGGGARAAYQLGVLKYVFTELGCSPESPIFVGTSAGAINASYLSMNAHKGFREAILELCDLWSNLTVDRIYRTDPWSILRGIGNFVFNFTLGRFVKKRHIESLLDTTPLYFFLRDNLERHIHLLHENIESGRIRALGISAMQYGTGYITTFYQASPQSGIQPWFRPRREGRPTHLRLKHVLASAAIPLLFPSVKLENCYYGDGSIRKMAPLSPAIQLGASKIFAVGLRPMLAPAQSTEFYPSVSQIVGMIFNSIFLDVLDHDVRILERFNRLVEHTPPLEGIRKVAVKIIRPNQDLGLLALPYKEFVPKTLSFLLRGLGPTDRSGADFLSYILFDKHYLKALIDQGFKDAASDQDNLRAFFSPVLKREGGA